MNPAPELLERLRSLWEGAVPELATQSKAWGPTLRALSNRFNRIEGAPRGDYFDTANLTPYFVHHGWAQACALAAIAGETPEALAGRREVWDLGGGPGVLTLAASALLPDANFLLADLRTEALAWAEARLRPLGVNLRTQKLRLPEIPEGRPDLILLGHVLNELAPQDQESLLLRLREALASGGTILILEPALMASTRRLMELREWFRKPPFTIAAPCPCPGPCPMLALDRQWCVAELPWTPPDWFQALDRAAGLDRKVLTFAYLLARRDHPGKAPVARIVGVPKPQKGKVERWLCTPGGGERWEALTRHGVPEWALPRTQEVPWTPDALKDLAGGWKLRRIKPN